MRSRWLFLVVLTTGVVLVDQITKALVAAHLPLNAEWAPIPDLAHLFAITYTTNTGAAFGIFPDSSVILLLIAVVVTGLILHYYRTLPNEGGRLIRLALALQLGGALGNLIDRVRLGHVVDFIHVKLWPVFNVADSCIVIGVVLLAGALVLEERRDRRQPRREDPPEDAPRPSPEAE